jgi:hypothetical protein
MVDFTLDQDFSVQMAKLEETDLVHSDTFNPLYKQLINNDNKLNDNKIETSEKGAIDGVATLDLTGNVPATQLNNVHDKYTDSEAVAAINNDGDHGSTAQHDYFSGDYLDLVNKPSIAYSTAIPADNFTSGEVSNLRSNQLANGVDPFKPSIKELSNSYTILESDYTLVCDAAVNDVTVTLPDATVNTGRIYHIKRMDNSSYTVTIDTTNSQTIDGETMRDINIQYETITVQSTGNEWVII